MGHPQVPGESLRVHVDLVNVPVTVLDAKGRPVTGLRREDFALTEDGHPEAIRVFQANAARPLSVVLAIDASVSVRKELPLAKQAAYEFVRSLLQGEEGVNPSSPTICAKSAQRMGHPSEYFDRVEVLEFSGEVTRVVPFTGNRRAVDRGLHSLHADGPTALYAAIARAAKDLGKNRGRKIILVVSDGSNSVAGVDYEQARAAALRAQASIESVILVPIEANAGRDLGGEHALIQLARDTGGQYFYADSINLLQDAMTRLSLGLRSEYLLGYYPAQTGNLDRVGFRRIQLQMTNPAWNKMYHLQYRTGYYADGAR